MKRVLGWRILVFLLIVSSILFNSGIVSAQTSRQDSGETVKTETVPDVVAAQAVQSDEPVMAVGTLSLIQRQQIVLRSGGEISTIHVKVGDRLKKGDLLISLDTPQLEVAVVRAALALEKLKAATDQSAISLAAANLLSTQESLALVEASPTADELKAAESRVNAAWATYNSIKDGLTQAQLKQLQANRRKAEVAVKLAQREYDAISWQPDIGASAASAALQNATIDLEAAQGAFEETTTISIAAPASSLSTALDAKFALSILQSKPTAAELASAKATVVAAQTALAATKQSPAIDIRLEEIRVSQAEIDLKEARSALANSTRGCTD